MRVDVVVGMASDNINDREGDREQHLKHRDSQVVEHSINKWTRSTICAFKRGKTNVKTFFAFPNVNSTAVILAILHTHTHALIPAAYISLTEFRHSIRQSSLCEWNEEQIFVFMIAPKAVYASAIKFYLVSHSAKFDPFSGSHFEWHTYISHDSRQRMRMRNKH